MISLSGEILHKMWIFAMVYHIQERKREKKKLANIHFGVSAKYQNRSCWKKKTSEISRGLWQQFRNMWEFNCPFLCAIPLASRFLPSSVLKSVFWAFCFNFPTRQKCYSHTSDHEFMAVLMRLIHTKWMLDEEREDKNCTSNG